MQMFRPLEQDEAALIGWGVNAALATGEIGGGSTLRKLRKAMTSVEHFDQVYDVMSILIDDPRAYEILVVDCDYYGGIESCRRICAVFKEENIHVPVILVSKLVSEQVFPNSWYEPIVLRSPLSAVALRVAMEKAFQGRLVQSHA